MTPGLSSPSPSPACSLAQGPDRLWNSGKSIPQNHGGFSVSGKEGSRPFPPFSAPERQALSLHGSGASRCGLPRTVPPCLRHSRLPWADGDVFSTDAAEERQRPFHGLSHSRVIPPGCSAIRHSCIMPSEPSSSAPHSSGQSRPASASAVTGASGELFSGLFSWYCTPFSGLLPILSGPSMEPQDSEGPGLSCSPFSQQVVSGSHFLSFSGGSERNAETGIRKKNDVLPLLPNTIRKNDFGGETP